MPKDTYVAPRKTNTPSISDTVRGDVSVATAPRMSPAQLMALAAKGFAATLPKAGTGSTVAQGSSSRATNATLGSVFAQLDASLEGRQLALPNLIGGALLDFGVGALAPVFGARAQELLKPILGRLTPAIQALSQGAFEAAGGQAADILRDPAKLEELWANEQARGDMVRLFILGTLTNAVPWDSLTPNLKNQVFEYLGVEGARGVGTIADELLKNAAMQAGTLISHPDFLDRLRSGELTPEQAVQEMQEQGINIFGGDIEVDPAVTAAMVRVLLEGSAP